MRLKPWRAYYLIALVVSGLLVGLLPILQAEEQYFSTVTSKGVSSPDRVGSTTNTIELLAGQTFMMVQASQAGLPKEASQGLQPPIIEVTLEREGRFYQVWRWTGGLDRFGEGLSTFALGPYGTVSGPGRLHFIGADTLFTYKIIPGPDNPQKTSIVLPGPENAMNVTMEVSTDLSSWVATTNGLKSGEVAQFFRIRLQKSSLPQP
ncbi:MAG: hypothetical protein JNN07_08005 [Verrucomicrobiales bacterium]|nr:hypothetical protein [Verrucomicrobiales bacterium]